MMFLQPQVDDNNKLINFSNDLATRIPKFLEGKYTTSCCGKGFVHSKEDRESKWGFVPKVRHSCPYCIVGMRVKTKQGSKYFERSKDDKIGVYFFQEEMKDGSSWSRHTYHNPNVKMSEPEFGMWMHGDSKNQDTEFIPEYKETDILWDKSAEYSVIKNIMAVLSDLNVYNQISSQGSDVGRDSYWSTGFGMNEISFLRENNLYDEFNDLRMIGEMYFKQELIQTIDDMRQRMSAAGQILY